MSPEELIDAAEKMEFDDVEAEIAAMSDEEVARAIDADGGDARAIGDRGARSSRRTSSRGVAGCSGSSRRTRSSRARGRVSRRCRAASGRRAKR
jgi:hypothetical protein